MSRIKLLVILLSLLLASNLPASTLDLKYTYVQETGDPFQGSFGFRTDTSATEVYLSQGGFSFLTSGGRASGPFTGKNIMVQTQLSPQGGFPVDLATGQFTEGGQFFATGDLTTNFTITVRFYSDNLAADWFSFDTKLNHSIGGSGHWGLVKSIDGVVAFEEHCEPSSLVLGLIGVSACLLRTRRIWSW